MHWRRKCYPILCNPMDSSPPGSAVHRISQGRILEWVAIPFLGDLPNPGIESQPWLTGCVTLGTSYMFIHLFTLTCDTLNLEILDAPNSFCSFWRHPSSLSTSQILSPVLTSFNLIPLLSDATLGVRGLWGL